MAAGGVRYPHRVIRQCGDPDQRREVSMDDLTHLPCGRNPVGGALQATGDGRGTLIQGPPEAAGTVNRLWSIPGGGVTSGPFPEISRNWIVRSVGDHLRDNHRRIEFTFQEQRGHRTD